MTWQNQSEYSSSIDSSLLLAIISDYDLADISQLREARQTLDTLQKETGEDDAIDFDPSGISGGEHVVNIEQEDECASARSILGWKSSTDNTSLGHDMASLDLEGLEFAEHDLYVNSNGVTDQTYVSDWDVLDDAAKEERLLKIFPVLKPFDVKWTMKKCKGNANLAIDELMFQSFLEESGSRQRGIEAFSESDLPTRPRKSKGKKKRDRPLDEALSSPDFVSPVQDSKWEVGKQEVDFIATKTGMPIQQVNSIYHNSGASVRFTIAAIVEAHKEMNMKSDDPLIQISAFELSQDFPSIPSSDLTALLQITHPSTSSARELAKSLVPRPNSSKIPIHLEFRHAPIDLSSEPARSEPISHNAIHPSDIATASAMVKTYNDARNEAFTQAVTAYRRGKSDPLMGGAAAYYSQVGRDFDARAKNAQSAAADGLVASQSSKTELDLHGVNVKDAVRISRERVTTWWHELGEGRIGGSGVEAGYRIVTGVGRHSEGGKGKLGPAVGKMLIREGWKVQVGSGVLIVTGVVK